MQLRLLPILLLSLSGLSIGEIVPAYGHIPGGGFRVPLPATQVPWKDLALQIVSKDAEKPNESRLTDLWQNKDNFGIAEVNFQVPVPAAMKSRKYFVISADGLTPLRMRGMVGAIRYRFDPDGTQADLKEVGFQGAAVFDTVPEDEYVEGAFVVDSDTALTGTATEVQPTAIASTKEGEATRVTWAGKNGLIKSPTTSRPDAAASLAIGSDQYLFLRWHPEGTSCEFIFTLLKVGATSLDEAANTVYGCEF